jgi:hypothetical protein
MEKEKGLAFGEAFLRLETPALPKVRPTEPQAGTSATRDVHSADCVSHSAASASSSAESASHSTVDASTSAELHLTLLQSSGFDTAESASHPAESVTNTAASQLIQCRSVSLSSISTTFLTPMKSITRRKGGGGGGYPTTILKALERVGYRGRITPRELASFCEASGTNRPHCERTVGNTEASGPPASGTLFPYCRFYGNNLRFGQRPLPRKVEA